MANRKEDHISLALTSQIPTSQLDSRFSYEPLLNGYKKNSIPPVSIGGKTMHLPIWISSMTGGTKLAGTINQNLATAAAEFGMGMGLGSCSILLKNEKAIPDFDLRGVIGDDRPFYANMGIAQVEQHLQKDDINTIIDLVNLLKTDGIVIHINPLQEMLQPEGDKIDNPPRETLKEFLKQFKGNVIVKEVGQGMGPESIRELMKLPLTAIEFGGFGGTNFSRIEIMRNNDSVSRHFEPLAYVGHSAEEMVSTVNEFMEENTDINPPLLIISGGIKNFLDGYYLIRKSNVPAIYGMASALLEYALLNYDDIKNFISAQKQGLEMAYNYLKVK